MRETRTHFEQVPVEEAEKVLEQENRLAERDGNCELVVENSGTSIEPQIRSRKSRASAA
jgi:hypothetical protein